jgi:hypothetical protein
MDLTDKKYVERCRDGHQEDFITPQELRRRSGTREGSALVVRSG